MTTDEEVTRCAHAAFKALRERFGVFDTSTERYDDERFLQEREGFELIVRTVLEESHR